MGPVTHLWKTPVPQDQVHQRHLVFLHPFGQVVQVHDVREEIGSYLEGILRVVFLIAQATLLAGKHDSVALCLFFFF